MVKILGLIKDELDSALKGKEERRVSALRFVLSNLHNEEIAKQRELTDEEVLVVLRKQVRNHQESIEAFKKGQREDLVQKEEEEKKVLDAFLPAQLSEEQIKQVVQDVISSGISDFGPVMSQVMMKLKGQADGGVVAKVVKEILTGGTDA